MPTTRSRSDSLRETPLPPPPLVPSPGVTVEELTRQIRKQEFDFTTIFEVATQINAHVLDDRHIESYLKFLAHYLTTLARGQFGLTKAYLHLQPDLDVMKITLAPLHRGDAGPMPIEAEGEFGRLLQKQGGPFRLEEVAFAAGAPPEAAALRKLGVVLCVPLLMAGVQIGTSLKGLLTLGPKLLGGAYTPSELRLLGLLANMAAVAVHNAQLHRKSIVDHLTQLYSRGHFDLHLAAEISRAERYGRKELEPRRFVTLILMDIDHFKSFNDAHGHPVGDRVLRAVARSVQKAVRKSDVVARYGGEEFVLIAVETSKEDGAVFAERLRKQVAQTTIMVEGTPKHVTASFGVATYPIDARSASELVAKADGALYRAKGSGRNRICVYA
jgi:diguanylate cyclase (GGDEF)-like protein